MATLARVYSFDDIFIAGRSVTESSKRSSTPAKSTDRMYTPAPARKAPLIDLSKSPTCSNIAIRVSDITGNSEKSKDDEGIIDLDDSDEDIDVLDALVIRDDDDDDDENVETLSDTTDQMDESTESDDDVVVTGEITRNGDAFSMPFHGESPSRRSPFQSGSPTRLSESLQRMISSPPSHPRITSPPPYLQKMMSPSLSPRRMISPPSACECRPQKRSPVATAGANGHLNATALAPLAPGGKSAISPVARARLSSSSQAIGCFQLSSVDWRSPLTPSNIQTSVASASSLVQSPAAPVPPVAVHSSPAHRASPMSAKNLKVPRLVYKVPNNEIDEEMLEKYRLKNFSIHLSKAKCAEAIDKQKKVNFLQYFNVVERSELKAVERSKMKGVKRSKLKSRPIVKPIIIGGLNKQDPRVIQKRIPKGRQQDRRPLGMVRKKFRSSANPSEKLPPNLVRLIAQ